MDYAKESLRLHGEWKGKIEMVNRVPVKTKDDLSLAYTMLFCCQKNFQNSCIVFL